ncbi:MAG: 3-deoxy-D-manno-octulosonic acid transferase [Gammaproteobacteria bacterium]|nr:3-deoxy-D-manno-octulosonic acid transferase [Gammaproteobacteria bacterium]
MYRLAMLLLTPYALYYTLRRSLRDGGWRYLRQRLGLGLPDITQRPLWTHCASVGEVHAAAPLLHALRTRYPALPMLVTTNTPTGAAAARNRLPDTARHCYLPIDWVFAARAFARRVHPRAAIVLETELWPRAFARIAATGAPIVIVNGRLSQRSLGVPRWLQGAQRTALQHVSAVLARNDEDARAFEALGARPGTVQTVGNLKFAAIAHGAANPQPVVEPPYWLAASTHAPEERLCARVQLDNPQLPLLVIAPRYPERGSALAAELTKLGAQVALRSRNDDVSASARIYIADTLGELDALFAHAQLAFIGGSFAPRGGQNLLEAARHGCPVIVGPHMQNFADETRRLLDAGAALQLDNSDALQETIIALSADPQRRDELRSALLQTMRTEAHVLERYLERLQQLWGDQFALEAFE